MCDCLEYSHLEPVHTFNYTTSTHFNYYRNIHLMIPPPVNQNMLATTQILVSNINTKEYFIVPPPMYPCYLSQLEGRWNCNDSIVIYHRERQ